MSGDPLVSVVVPAWNAERTLLETLESVEAQTHRNIEIIIVDDGSTDGTTTIADAFCRRDPRARLVRQANGGVASARNCGIQQAQGDWIAPIDADDLWHSTKIEKQLAAALAAPRTPGLVYCWYHSIDEAGLVLGSGPQWRFENDAFEQFAYCNPVQNGSTLLLSRSAIAAAGGYDSSLRAHGAEGCEDVLIQLTVARDCPVALVPEFLVGYRKHAAGMSRDTDQIVRSWKQVYGRLADGIPRCALRWNAAFFDKVLAEDSFARGRRGNAFVSYARALSRDPVRWGAYALYRIARTMARLVRGRKPASAPVSFAEAKPHRAISPDPDALPRLERLLLQIDERRLDQLKRSSGARLDRSRTG